MQLLSDHIFRSKVRISSDFEVNGSVELSWLASCILCIGCRWMQAMQDAFRVVLACLRHPAIITFRAWFEGAESWCHRIIADTLNYGTLQNSLSHSGQYHAVHFCFFSIDKLGKNVHDLAHWRPWAATPASVFSSFARPRFRLDCYGPLQCWFRGVLCPTRGARL